MEEFEVQRKLRFVNNNFREFREQNTFSNILVAYVLYMMPYKMHRW